MTWKGYAVTAALTLILVIGLILIAQSMDDIREGIPFLSR